MSRDLDRAIGIAVLGRGAETVMREIDEEMGIYEARFADPKLYQRERFACVVATACGSPARGSRSLHSATARRSSQTDCLS
jgi:hypothetical protein